MTVKNAVQDCTGDRVNRHLGKVFAIESTWKKKERKTSKSLDPRNNKWNKGECAEPGGMNRQEEWRRRIKLKAERYV